MANKISKQSVSFEDRDREIVKGISRKLGLNFSAALRLIIREWDDELNRYHITDRGREAIRRDDC